MELINRYNDISATEHQLKFKIIGTMSAKETIECGMAILFENGFQVDIPKEKWDELRELKMLSSGPNTN